MLKGDTIAAKNYSKCSCKDDSTKAFSGWWGNKEQQPETTVLGIQTGPKRVVKSPFFKLFKIWLDNPGWPDLTMS